MLIIDLNTSYHVKKPQKPPELIISPPKPVIQVQVVKNPIPDPEPIPVQSAPDTDEKARLLRQLSDEDARVRIERSKHHRKYFDLLTPDLLPKPGADFSDIYAQMDEYQRQLQGIWIRRQQVEKYGILKSTSPVTKEQLTQLSALKHDRSNAYKNLSKWEKKLSEATGKNSTQGIANAKVKIDEIELNILDLTHQINELNERVKIAR